MSYRDGAKLVESDDKYLKGRMKQSLVTLSVATSQVALGIP